MASTVVTVPSIKTPVRPSPGFAKKELSTWALDLMGLCQFGCRYCSSNWGNYLRINRAKHAKIAHQQTGQELFPDKDPELVLQWPDVLKRLEAQLLRKSNKSWGSGQTLVFSMLTDAFSPINVKSGLTRAALDLVLAHTGFRIRVLTKNAVVGKKDWIDFFLKHPNRFVVGLSIGTLDDEWAKKVETFTPPPTRRIEALHALQDAGVPTYGMLCPMMPSVLEGKNLEDLIDAIRPSLTERVWAEPYNDRHNWATIRDCFPAGSKEHVLMQNTFGPKARKVWSTYATDLYVRLRDKARQEGWIEKLVYLLYETNISLSDAKKFKGLEGVLLQSKPRSDGKSQNAAIAAIQ